MVSIQGVFKMSGPILTLPQLIVYFAPLILSLVVGAFVFLYLKVVSAEKISLEKKIFYMKWETTIYGFFVIIIVTSMVDSYLSGVYTSPNITIIPAWIFGMFLFLIHLIVVFMCVLAFCSCLHRVYQVVYHKDKIPPLFKEILEKETTYTFSSGKDDSKSI